MKKKQIFDFAQIVLLLCGLSLAACKNNYMEPSEQENEQLQEQDLDQAAEFWSVVGQLTDDVMPDEDWQSADYVPSIGQPDGANNAVRIVSCADEESAAQRFAELVGLTADDGFSADIREYTYSNSTVGTLHYQKTGGVSLSTVDIDIDQMPGLSQIVYKTPDQLGENGSFSGTAYYRFGDVVAKTNSDGQTDYWICVRPCFGPEGKGDSHWITLSRIPTANTKSVSKNVNGIRLSHLMPKSLCANQSHMQNLAELLYAMLNPEQWAANLKSNSRTLKYFKDFNYTKNYQYNNQYFFENVALGWDSYGLFRDIFGLTKEELRQELGQNGLNLIYSSATMSGNNISLPLASFSGANLKTSILSKKTSAWAAESFNIYDLSKKGYLEFTNVAGGTERAWLVRYATGATLAKGGAENPRFDKYKRLPNCRDVYVYNRDVESNLNIENLPAIAPRVTTKRMEEEYTGNSHYRWCDVYKDEEGCRWFVVSMSGKSELGLEEGSPYSELITFDGIKYTADKSRATNLPTREQAIRGAYWLDLGMFTNTATNKYFKKEDWKKGWYGYGYSLFHLKEYAGFEMSTLFQLIWPQNNNPRDATHAASIAYDDHITSNKQPLLRWVTHNQNAKKDFYFYIWDSYPRVPSPTNQLVTEFSNIPIYLQDLTDPQKVERYGTDAFVTQPLAKNDGTVATEELVPRYPREEDDTDERANDVTNYFYNRSVWWNRTFATDMWYAPVIMFRITRVLDRGDDNYSTVTVDGHRLTLYRERLWGEDGDGDDIYEVDVRGSLAALYQNMETIYFNGQPTSVPSWRSAW